MNHIWGEERECDKVVWGFRKWTIIGQVEWVSYWEKLLNCRYIDWSLKESKDDAITSSGIVMTSRYVKFLWRHVAWHFIKSCDDETWLKDLPCAVDLLNETIRFLDNFDLDVKNVLVTSDVCRFRRFSDKIGISTNFTYLFWQFSYGVSIVEHLHK